MAVRILAPIPANRLDSTEDHFSPPEVGSLGRSQPRKSVSSCQALSESLDKVLQAMPVLQCLALSARTSSGITSSDVSVQAANSCPSLLLLVHEQLSSVLRELTLAGSSEGVNAAGVLLGMNVVVKLVACLEALSFEARKCATRVFVEVARQGMWARFDQLVLNHPNLIEMLLAGCGKADIFWHSAAMLHSLTNTPEMHVILLDAGVTFELVRLAAQAEFEISCEAFFSLRELLLKHPVPTERFMKERFAEFFHHYHSLLVVEAYTVVRQAERLLGEILLQQEFQQVRTAYVSNPNFLRIHMNLFRIRSVPLQLEAFHIFKVFVANPKRPSRVTHILRRNRDRLIGLLQSFHEKGHEDEDFCGDLFVVIRLLRSLGCSQIPC